MIILISITIIVIIISIIIIIIIIITVSHVSTAGQLIDLVFSSRPSVTNVTAAVAPGFDLND